MLNNMSAQFKHIIISIIAKHTVYEAFPYVLCVLPVNQTLSCNMSGQKADTGFHISMCIKY